MPQPLQWLASVSRSTQRSPQRFGVGSAQFIEQRATPSGSTLQNGAPSGQATPHAPQ
jgi:hypothetical protein